MCITEYNEAETMQMFKAEGRKEGKLEIIIQLIHNGLITLEAGAEQLHMAMTDLEKYL